MIRATVLAKAQQTETGSRQIRDPWRGLAGKVVEPPFDLAATAKLLELSTEHLRCVRSKAADVAGHGHELVPVERVDDAGNKIEADQAHGEVLEDFFSWPNEEQTFRDLIEVLMTDFESLGNAYLEVVRKLDASRDPPWGPPAKLYHIPAKTMRVLRSGEGFVQVRGGKRRFFKRFGDRRVMDCETGQFATSGLDLGKHATEVIHFRRYHPASDYYGIPDFLPAASAILGSARAAEFNIAFFENRAVPDCIVVVEGGFLGEEAREAVRRYFEEELQGASRSHKTLVLEAFADESGEARPAVRIEKLSKGPEEASFIEYLKLNRDEIIRAHEVPPARVSIIETGNIGAGSGLAQYKIYKETVIEPRQAMLEQFFNRRIIWDEEDGFGFTDWRMKFKDFDLSDLEARSRIDERYLKAKAFTINEVRREQGKPDLGAGGDLIFFEIGGTLVFLDELEELRKIPLAERLGLMKGVGT